MNHKKLNVALLSIAGGASKTTLAKHLFAPQLPNSVVISIEDWNSSDGTADLEVSAKAFYNVAAQINVDETQSFVLDIGASNSKEMMRHFQELELTTQALDFFVVPVRAGAKERLDTLKTIHLLTELGIEPHRIVVIASAITDVSQFDSEFGVLSKAAADNGICFAPQAVLFNQVFDLIKGADKSVFDLVAEKPDFQLLKSQHRGNEKMLMSIGKQMVTYSLALTAARNLKSVFDSTPISQALVSTE